MEEEDPRYRRAVEVPRHGGGPTSWRSCALEEVDPCHSHAMEEEEPVAMVPRHRRGSRWRRDAGAHRRQALTLLQQQRPLESASRQSSVTLVKLQQQLVTGELQQQ
jgi:hypothetical protein